MEKENYLLEEIKKYTFEILVYFFQNFINDASPSDIEYFLHRLQRSLRTRKDRRSSNSFQIYLSPRSFREDSQSDLFKIYENYRTFFRLREENPRLYNFKDFNMFFKNLDNKIDAFSKTVKNTIDKLIELKEEKEDSNKNNRNLFKACTYWYMNSMIMPKFSEIHYAEYKQIRDFKRMLQYAFVLFFRLYEQSSMDFQNLNVIELDLEMDYLIQDINNMIRFTIKIK